jgi:HEAT repeat protein
MQCDTNLIKNLESSDIFVQAQTLMKLLDIECYEAVPYIIPLLKSSNINVRSTSAYVLGELGDEDDMNLIKALINALNDPEEIVRSDVIEALGLLLVEEAVPKVCELLLNDPSALVRASAAEALGEIGNVNCINTLDLVITNPHENLSVCRYAHHSRNLLLSEK